MPQPLFLRTVMAASVAALGACTAPAAHLGLWTHETTQTDMKFQFQPDGTCSWSIFVKRDNGPGDGIGSYCRYVVTQQGVAITTFTDEADKLPKETLPEPLQFRLDRATGEMIYLTTEPIALRRKN